MFSKLLRRSHLYLALFLTPWVLLYALSTFVMNHRDWFRGEPAEPPAWTKVSEQVYDGQFPADANFKVMAKQILMSLELDGAHTARMAEGKLVIIRNEPRQPVRLTYSLESRTLLVERQAKETTAFLERMHRRRGFQHDYVREDAWAFSVDLFLVAMLFWSLSGVWLWWEMKVTRWFGAAALVAGFALFAFFLRVL